MINHKAVDVADGCPACKARMKAEGLESAEQLQSYMIRRMERFANGYGKRIIGWDEILQGGLAPNPFPRLTVWRDRFCRKAG